MIFGLGSTDIQFSFSDDSIQPMPGDPPTTVETRRVEVLGCGANILDQRLYAIKSHSGLGKTNYTANYTCTYSLRPADVNGVLYLKNLQFDLQASVNCTADFLDIAGVDRFCGSRFPREYYVITASELAITFQTDGQDAARGFYFTAIALKPEAAGDAGLPCGTTLLERGNHTILSKNYPAKYEPYSYCKWQLQAIENTDRVELSCDSFRLENFGSRCEMDWMAVDGVRYCGTTAPSVATVGELSVEFVADYFAQQKGFNCTVVVSEGGAV